jgi:YfiH family protein
LLTSETDLALSVATADCLPVVLVGEHHLAVIHAGWRGLVGGIIPTAVRTLPEEPESLQTWIGPAIGACCYEVGIDVAESVASASGPEVVVSMSRKPHLDLVCAAKIQLAELGVTTVSSISTCTRCSPDSLASYRRDGTRAGRNWTFAWRRLNAEE